MRVSMWSWVVGIAVAATGCSEGRNTGGPNAGTNQTHTVNRPVDGNSQTSSGASSSTNQTGSGAASSNAPANPSSTGTGTGSGQSGVGGTGGTAPGGK
jgi:hypothetical protein